MLQRVTWRSWTALAAVLAIYVSLGFWLSGNGGIEEQVYKWGLLAAALAPFAFIGIYAASGNRFWANNVGSALVQVALCMVPIAGPLAWVFWVDHGLLNSSLLAWIEVSGPVLSALAMARLCWVFIRIQQRDRRGRDGVA